MTPGTVSKLQAAFQRGFSVTTACKIARISRDTYYKWLKESEEFSDRMEGAQEYAKILAGDVILDVLQDIHRGKKDPQTGQYIEKKYNEATVANTARWFVEKTEREVFGSQSLMAAKVESDGKGGQTVTIVHASDGTFTNFSDQFNQIRTNPGSEEALEGQLLESLESGTQGEGTA